MTNYAIRKVEKEALAAGLATEIFQRLPTNTAPDNYLICLKPNWKNLSFEGSEIVHLTIFSEAKEVVLNAADLTVGKIMWEEDVTENRQEPLEYAVDVDNELLKIVFEPPLNPSQGTLRINFSGVINSKGNKGFFKPRRLVGQDLNGLQSHQSEMIEHHDHHHQVDDSFAMATSFQFIHARRCFPCWDEPAIKATFDICLILPRDVTALSNMHVKVTYPHRSKKSLHTVEFRRTPRMSTYLLTFCVGKFDFVWNMTADKLLCHVYTFAGKKKLGQMALDFLVKVLPFVNDYFGFPYPLQKLDMVALADYSPMAMENWGMIAFHEDYFLTDANSSHSFIQQMLLLVAHKISHQWFGNLVTMDWYSYLWINEGMATFMSYLIVDNFYPEYEVWSKFVCECQLKVMEADAMRFSRAVECNVNNPSDIAELYDALSYYKGASLIRMLYNYVGDEDFQRGIALYFERYQFKTATSGQLWRVFEEVTEKPVQSVMTKWATYTGFPLIKVHAKQEGNYRVFTLTQERYHGDATVKDRVTHKETKDPLWTIPITFSSAAKPELTKVLMDKKVITVNVLIGKAHWVSINPGQQGYFRVRYCPECFTQFLSAVRQKSLHIQERLGIIGDLFAMTQTGLSSTVEILSVLEAFVEETNYYVWKLISSIITRLHTLLEPTEFYATYLSYVRSILKHIEEKTSWDSKENEGHLASLRRTVILTMLAEINQDAMIQESQKRFELFSRGELEIPTDLKGPIYMAILRSADEETVRGFFKNYRESDSAEERNLIANSLGSVRAEDRLKLVLDFSISEDVRLEHSFQIMSNLSLLKEGRELLWSFFKEHLSAFRHRYSGPTLMTRVVRIVTENFMTEEKLVEITEFFREHHVPGMERAILLSCERIRLHDAWLKRDVSHIQDYLSSYP